MREDAGERGIGVFQAAKSTAQRAAYRRVLPVLLQFAERVSLSAVAEAGFHLGDVTDPA